MTVPRRSRGQRQEIQLPPEPFHVLGERQQRILEQKRDHSVAGGTCPRETFREEILSLRVRQLAKELELDSLGLDHERSAPAGSWCAARSLKVGL